MPIRKAKLKRVVRQRGYKGNTLCKCVLVEEIAAERLGGHGFQRFFRYLLGSTVFFSIGVVGGAGPRDTGTRSLAAVILPADAAAYFAGERRSRAGLY